MKSGAIAAFTAGAFFVVGNLTDVVNASPIGSHTQPDFGSPAYAFNIAGHALVGCASAEVSGGKCGPAALAGGVTSAAGPFVNKLDFAPALVANSVVGGAAAVAGGGKFQNGAITGAVRVPFHAAGGRVLGNVVGWIVGGIGGVETGPGGVFIAYALGEVFSRIEDSIYGVANSFGADGKLDLQSRIGILRDAAGGKGNFGLGSASQSDSALLGEAWVGPGYSVASDGTTLVSDDGLRQYRPPSFKPSLGITQSNFEMRFEPSGQWQSNGHLNIIP